MSTPKKVTLPCTPHGAQETFGRQTRGGFATAPRGASIPSRRASGSPVTCPDGQPRGRRSPDALLTSLPPPGLWLP